MRNASRPITTGRQTFTNASPPMNPSSPITNVAHGSRWPPPPTCTLPAIQVPAPMNARRHVNFNDSPNQAISPAAKTSSQRTMLLAPISTPSSRTMRGATIVVPAPSTTPSPIDAPWLRYASQRSSDESAPNAAGSALSMARNSPSSTPRSSATEKTAGRVTFTSESPSSTTSVSVELAETRAAAAAKASTSSAVTKPALSIRLTSTPSSAARSEAFRVTFRGPASRGGSGEARSRRAFAASRSASDCAMSPIDEPSSTSLSAATRWTSVPSPAASISIDAFDVSTTQSAWPLRTSTRSSTSHSASSADSLFASSRVSTTSSRGVSLPRVRVR